MQVAEITSVVDRILEDFELHTSKEYLAKTINELVTEMPYNDEQKHCLEDHRQWAIVKIQHTMYHAYHVQIPFPLAELIQKQIILNIYPILDTDNRKCIALTLFYLYGEKFEVIDPDYMVVFDKLIDAIDV